LNLKIPSRCDRRHSPYLLCSLLKVVQKALDNRYLLEFRAVPGKKSGLRYVKLTTEVAGVEIDSADSVWVKAK
jgi:hypothetical protein